MRSCAMAPTHLTGRWRGHYVQRGRQCPISGDLREAEGRLSGFMYDGEPDREYSVSQVAADAGLPAGADEQIEANVRGMVPDDAQGPVRYVTHLPTNSVLQGKRTGQAVY